MNFWTNELRRGVPAARVRGAILGSDDYYVANGRSDEGFMVGLFRDVAGRPTSVSEVRHQVARFREKTGGTRAAFAEDFIVRAQRGEFTPITTWNPNRPVVVVENTTVVPVVVVPVPVQPNPPPPVDPNAPPANPFR